MSQNFVQNRVGVLLTVAVLWLAPGARAEDRTWEAAIKDLAKKLEPLIKEKGGKARVEFFHPAGAFNSNPSPGVAHALRKELTLLGVFMDGAPVAVVGRIDAHEDTGGAVVVLIQARLTKNGAEEERSVKTDVCGSHALEFVGWSGEPSPTTPPNDIRKELDNIGKNLPTDKNKAPNDAVVIDGKAKARKDGLFAMEIVIVKGGRTGPCAFVETPAKTGEHKLLAADLKKDEQFHVVLHNKSEWEAIAALKVDGLNVLNTFRGTNNLGFIVEPGAKVVIQGWQMDERYAETFKIVDIQESVFFKKSKLTTNFPPDLGTITASFTRSWDPKTGKAPAGGNGLDKGEVAVGGGDKVDSQIISTPRYYEDQPYSVISVRYVRGK